jgi:hypothetical protein
MANCALKMSIVYETLQRADFIKGRHIGLPLQYVTYRLSEKCLVPNIQGFGNEVAERSTLEVFREIIYLNIYS